MIHRTGWDWFKITMIGRCPTSLHLYYVDQERKTSLRIKVAQEGNVQVSIYGKK